MEHAVKVRMPSSWSGKLNMAAELQGISKHGLLVRIVKEWLEAKGYGTEETNTDMPRLRVAGHPWRGRRASGGLNGAGVDSNQQCIMVGQDQSGLSGPESVGDNLLPIEGERVEGPRAKSYWEEPR